MPWTQAELDAIESAFKTGVRTVEYAGRKTEFRSLDEMRQIIADGRRELSNKPREPFQPKSFSRGYQQ